MSKSGNDELKKILKPICKHLDNVDKEILLRLKAGIPLIDNSSNHLFRRSGKKIRASLIILSSGLKNEISEDIIKLAAAAEIVHGASLVHDDIIDQAILRRGEPTVAKKWGNKIAVLVGDYMYTKALDVAIGLDVHRVFPVIVSAVSDMVKGELYQIQFSNVDIINKKHYFNIIELKTARFMAACSKLGAVNSGMTDEECDLLYRFGLNLGFSFQIVDDTLDVLEDPAAIGKDVGNDFLNGKITLPFLELLELSGDSEKEKLYEYARNPDADKWEIIRKKMKDADVVGLCLNQAREYVDKAMELLDYFPSSVCKSVISDLSHFLIERGYCFT